MGQSTWGSSHEAPGVGDPRRLLTQLLLLDEAGPDRTATLTKRPESPPSSSHLLVTCPLPPRRPSPRFLGWYLSPSSIDRSGFLLACAPGAPDTCADTSVRSALANPSRHLVTRPTRELEMHRGQAVSSPLPP